MNKRFVFFGTPKMSALALSELSKYGLVPKLIVTSPDTHQGRGLCMKETPVKSYAKNNNIACINPEKITDEIREELIKQGPWDFFIVVAYGKILKQKTIDITNSKVINIHPSLLPLYRGPSPLQEVLLSDDEYTGVTIMEIDAGIDHGPIIAQKSWSLEKTATYEDLETKSVVEGVKLIANNLEKYLSGELVPMAQDDTLSTLTTKIKKEDGYLINTMNDWEKWKKYRAYKAWPGVSYVAINKKDERFRVKIKNAKFENDKFIIEEVIPENKKLMSKESFDRWLSS